MGPFSKRDEHEPEVPRAELASTPEDRMFVYRQDRYLHYKFSEASAALLAGTRDADGFWLDHAKAKKMLDRGWTHDQILAVLL